MIEPHNQEMENIGYIKSEIRNQTVLILMALFLFLAVYLVDTTSRSINSSLMPKLLALELLLIAIFVLLLRKLDLKWLRWLPFLGLLTAPILIGWFVDAGVALLLITVVVVATPLLFNSWAGALVLLAYSAAIIWLFPAMGFLEPNQVLGILVPLWGLFGLIAVALNSLLEISSQLFKRYNESSALMEEARRTQSELNSLLKERTEANLQLARLNQLANNMRSVAENERSIKEEFIANVSHELRTPLNMVIGFCNVIFRSVEAYQRKLPKTLLTDLEVILRNSMHLSNLVNDILDLSQINAGQMAIVKEWTSIEEILKDSVVTVRPLFESKSLSLELKIDSPLPELSCDRTRIREVLLNLLSNAGRFTEEGGVTLSTAVEHNQLLITVSDTGIGISKEKQTRLFEPFFQADSSIRKKYGGTGLGLTISKKIIELHGGQINLTSAGEPGKGTTFIITLPIETSPAPDGKPPFSRWINPYMPAVHPPQHPWSADTTLQPRIVMVDDDGDLTRLLRRYLGDYEYILVRDIDQAKENIKSFPARFMLVNATDIHSAFEQLNQTDSLPFGAVGIVCSIPSNQRLWAYLDIKDTLIKPISQDQLVTSLNSLQEKAKTVLIVDDDPEIRNLFRRMLLTPDLGYHVLTADNGLHALQVMKRHQVDAIFLDLVMPKMDGIQFLAAKKNLPGYEEIPVFLISGHQANERTMVSAGLGIQVGGGMSIKQFLECINALAVILSPSAEPAPQPAAAPAG